MRQIKSALCALHPEKVEEIVRTLRTVEVATLLFLKKGKSITLESQKKWIPLKESQIFSNNQLLTSWFQTLILKLTENERILKPFWNEACKKRTDKIWLPSTDLPLKKEKMSWFSINTTENETSSSPSFIFVPVGQWEKDDVVIRARKLKLKLTDTQKTLFKQWRGTRRHVYNKVLYKINKDKEQINFFDLRNKYVTGKFGENPELKSWEVKSHMRASAIQDLVNNYKSAFSNLKAGNINKFKMKYLRKESKPAMTIPLKSIKPGSGKKESIKRTEAELQKGQKRLGGDKKITESKIQITLNKTKNKIYIYPTIMKEKIEIDKKFLKKKVKITTDCKIVEQNGVWYLIVPQKVQCKTVQEKQNTCSIDPGQRNFLTIYSEQRVSQIKIDKERIKKLLLKIDKIRSLRDTSKITKNKAKRTERRIRRQIDNLIDELHWKSINYLTNTFWTIIIPPFETQDIVNKSKNRHLNRNLLQLKHYLFQQRLAQKCEQKNRRKIKVTEEYTTQTCGRCGVLCRDQRKSWNVRVAS